MGVLPRIGICLLGLLASASAQIRPEAVAVLYNAQQESSRQLAELYREARGIPQENLIGLAMPLSEEITRDQYEQQIAGPLRAEFTRRKWWKLQRDAQGLPVPVENRIRVLLSVRGVPLKIRQSEAGGKASIGVDRTRQPFVGHDEAAVDSELATLGAEGIGLEGAQNNPYYRCTQTIDRAALPRLLLTCRIDAASDETCRRMIRDAIEIEKCGLWGMAYVDIANKFPQGDEWLKAVAAQNRAAGIPTAIDRFNATLPTHYPMRHAAQYFGWYERNANGPLLDPSFRFRQGAVAIHLHSFSAEQMNDVKRNWCAALLDRGAAVTLGNVYEPYLHLSHDFALLHQRLLQGHSWVEACWMAMPVVSWQGVIFGDPLYRPFLHLGGTGAVREEERDYRALCVAMQQWRNSPGERRAQLKAAALRMKSGIMLEALALDCMEDGLADKAAALFYEAGELYSDPVDKLRQDLHLAAKRESAHQRESAISQLRDAAKRHADLPQVAAVQAWLLWLDPPPPQNSTLPTTGP